jgi:hypothetical protein
MSNKIPFRTLSMNKSSNVIHKAVDVFDYQGPASAPEEFTRSTRSGTKRASQTQSAAAQEKEQLQVKAMQHTSRLYYEMQQLVAAIEVLMDWAELEIEFDQ